MGVVLDLERCRSAPDEKRSMEAAASRSGRGFDDEDDDDQEFAKREGFFFSHKGGSFCSCFCSLSFLFAFPFQMRSTIPCSASVTTADA